MPDIKVVDNVVQHFLHVTGYRDMPVWNKGGDKEAVTNQVLHALFEGHELHSRAASCLVPLKIIKDKNIQKRT